MKSLFERISLPLKAVIVGLLCGLIIWAVLDFIQTSKLQAILTKQLIEHLHEEAAGNRILFERYVKQHARAVKLIATHQPLVQWLRQRDKNEPAPELRQYRKERPPWFPSISAWRGLIDPRHVLLRDNQGRLREVYHIRDDDLPGAVNTDSLLTTLSQNQAYLTQLDGYPYLLASAPVADSQGQRWGELVLITQLDDQFLMKLHYTVSQRGPILALLEGTEGRVLASNSPARLSAGTALENLHHDYMVTGKPFFDYGASDLRLRLATFLPRAQIAALNERVLAMQRRHHIVVAILFIAAFTFLIFLLSRRINQLILRITAFAQRTLGSKQILPKWGDQLAYLDARINLLMEEILAARDAMRLRYETEQKAEQLRVLEAVTQELGIGILFLYNQGKERILNQQMSEFEAEYGKGWYCVDKSGQSGDVELKNRRHETRILHVSYLSLFKTGDVILARDATERKRAHRILQESEERFRNITQSANDAIISIDIAGNIISWNKAAARIFGYSESEILGKPLARFIPGQYHHAHEAGMDRVRAGHSSRVTQKMRELEGLRKDGASFPLELSVSTWTVEGIRYFTGIIRDITQRKRADEALRRERDFAEGLINTAQAIVLVLDLKGRIVSFNPFMEQLSGYRLEEVRGKDWFITFLPERDRPRIKELFLKAISDIQTQGNVNIIVTRTGGERYINWSDKTLKDAAGNPFGLLAIGHDITEHREQEAQLLQAEKLKVVGQLTDGIVHDFNNLLTVILGNLRLLEENIDRDLDPDSRELIDDAFSAAQDGAELIQRLLAFSRKQVLLPQPIEFNKFLKNLGRLLHRTLGKTIALKLNEAKDVLGVFADPVRLENALLNLAINARDAMPEGGVLTIETTRRRIGPAKSAEYAELAPGTYVIVAVSDTGIGMTSEQISRAIEPFYTSKAPGKGSGLGLSMVYNFARQSGGGLRITSEPGMGTTVSMLFPESIPAVEAGAEQEFLGDLPRGSETILVVEDEARVRKLARRSLKSLGYHVLEAKNAVEAIKILSSETAVDLLFSDVVIPGPMNGRELAGWTLANRPGLKVLLTSGFDKKVGNKRPVDNGGFSLLKKSYTKERLAKAVRAVLDTKTA